MNSEITNSDKANVQGERRGFEVQLGAFSGPLDLLCHLVESREMDPAKLNLTELVSQYVQFLLDSNRTTLNEMAEFFAFASRLLLRKVRSLFPQQPGEEAAEDISDDEYIETEEETSLSSTRLPRELLHVAHTDRIVNFPPIASGIICSTLGLIICDPQIIHISTKTPPKHNMEP